MADNVTIPLSLFNRLIELLGNWDISGYDAVIRSELREVTGQLEIKKRKLELRDDYAKIIRAKNEEGRHDARMNYLQAKRWLNLYDFPG